MSVALADFHRSRQSAVDILYQQWKKRTRAVSYRSVQQQSEPTGFPDPLAPLRHEETLI